ncbi:MAG: ANTAR domain-containing response regulator [Porcipelethomonas sp.]
MENIIVVSGNRKAAEVLVPFFKESFQSNVMHFDTAYQTRKLVESDFSCDLVLIDMPLPDEAGLKLAEYITNQTAACCILLAKAEYVEKISDTAEQNGIIVMSKPFSKNALYQAVKISEIAIKRFYKLYEETVRLEKKIDEIKIVDKAKFMLMQYRNITEEQAHEYLQQYAMNKHMKKSVAAYEIIDKISEHYM